MPSKHKKKSVAVQSANIFDVDFSPEQKPCTLTEKRGFRNLLPNSVIIISQENEDSKENFHEEGKSEYTQQTGTEKACLDYKSDNSGLEFFSSKKISCEPENELKTATSEMMGVIEGRPESPNPGTSKWMSGAHSSISVLPKGTNVAYENHEGSKTVIIYNYEKKPVRNFEGSNLTFLYGSQGTRRFSNEAVLLIEDYQSYGQANATRRQNPDSNHSLTTSCCFWSLNRSSKVSAKPVPIYSEKCNETEELLCRICHEGEKKELLIQPCLCKGSVGCVHASCLKAWLEQSNNNRCELCNYAYAIRQTKKYSKCVSLKVFYRNIINRRVLAYDITSFVVITPLTLVGVMMCIQASVFSTAASISVESTFQMEYITKVGMIMLSGTIIIAYAVWFYTLMSFHYKAWKKWYNNCYDIEVIPVRMTSKERHEASRKLKEEITQRRGSAVVAVLHFPQNYSFFQRHLPVPSVYSSVQVNR